MDNTKTMHWILGVALLMIGVFVVAALVMVNSQADEVTTTTLIENVAPTVDNVYINDVQYTLSDGYAGGTINTLAAGTTKAIYVNGIISDTNGDDDLSAIAAVIYRTAQTDSCSADDNDCYSNNTAGTCLIDTTYGTSNEAKFACPFSLQYYADSTDASSDTYSADTWTVSVTVTDDNSATDNDKTVTKEMGTLLSLNIPSTITFGTLALGASTVIADNQMMTIEQYGNDSADVEVSGTNLTCDGSTAFIPAGNVEWALTDVDYASGTDLTGTPADTNLNVAVRTGATTNQKIYWNIGIPVTGVEGTCTGTTTITTIAH
ncbi:MAG: hypothetical protein ABIH67_03470 [Candidatus Uhrbacteria bacterium]